MLKNKFIAQVYRFLFYLLKFYKSFEKNQPDIDCKLQEFRLKTLIAKKTIFMLNRAFVYKQFRKSKNGTLVINLYGLLGDLIAAEPIARFIKQKYPCCEIKWIVDPKYKSLIENNPFIDKIIEADYLAKVDEICQIEKENGSVIVDCLFNGRICEKTGKKHVNLINPEITNNTYFLYGGLLESFCLAAGLPNLKIKPKLWISNEIKNPLSKLLCDKKYVAVHAVSRVPSKNWSWEKWQYVVRELIKEGFLVVELGQEPHIRFRDQHFIDATTFGFSIIESLSILKQAKYFIGIDSAFAHAANAFNIPSIILLGKHANFREYSPFSNPLQKGAIIRMTDGFVSKINEHDVLSAFHEVSIKN